MSAVSTARNLSRKRRLLLPLTVLLCAAGLLLWLHHRAGLSPYTGQPSDQFLCTADADRYPLDTEQITFHVSNIGGYAEELDKPCLEMQKGGVWYSVHPQTRPARPPTCCTSPPGLLTPLTSPWFPTAQASPPDNTGLCSACTAAGSFSAGNSCWSDPHQSQEDGSCDLGHRNRPPILKYFDCHILHNML